MTTQTFPQYCITLLALPPLAFFFFSQKVIGLALKTQFQ